MIPALELRELQFVRGRRVLFDSLSAAVPPGRMLRVRGENGSGKTSLLRLICGLSRPTRGEVRWQGADIAASRDGLSQDLLYLSHAPALKDELSALENLEASCALSGLPCAAREASAALAHAGLREQARLPARLLSQGQRKRAALARLALAREAGLWVLDEPFNALDEAACQWLQTLISAQLARGAVVVLTSHQGRAWDALPPQIVLDLPPANPAAAAARRDQEAHA